MATCVQWCATQPCSSSTPSLQRCSSGARSATRSASVEDASLPSAHPRLRAGGIPTCSTPRVELQLLTCTFAASAVGIGQGGAASRGSALRRQVGESGSTCATSASGFAGPSPTPRTLSFSFTYAAASRRRWTIRTREQPEMLAGKLEVIPHQADANSVDTAGSVCPAGSSLAAVADRDLNIIAAPGRRTETLERKEMTASERAQHNKCVLFYARLQGKGTSSAWSD